jgi:hypothetical protein
VPSYYPVLRAAVPVSAGMIVAVPLELVTSPLRSGRGLGEADRSALVVGGTGRIRTGGAVAFLKVVAVAEAQVRRDGQVRAKGSPVRHATLGPLEGRLEAGAGPDVIDGIAEGARLDGRLVKGERERLLARAFMVRVIVLMTLMPQARIGDVIAALAGDLALIPWARPWHPASARSAGDWRAALGPVPLGELQDLVLGAAWREHQEEGCPGAVTTGTRRPLRAGSLDGTLIRVPDTPANRAFFGSVGTGDDSSPFPQARALPVTCCSCQAMFAMPHGPAGTGKAASEQSLLDQAMSRCPWLLDPGWIWLMDRNYHGAPRIARLIERTHVLIRLKSDIPLRRTSPILPDGSYQAELSGDGATIAVRVIEYHADVQGQLVPEMFCLVTDLMDYEDYPGPELARLYRWRWDGSETAVRHEAHCYIARRAGRDERRYLWVQCLTGARKSEWENSMAENRRPCPDVRGGASGDPHDKAKVGLPEARSPAGGIGHPSERHLKPVRASAAGWRGARCNPLRPRAMPSKGIQGDGKAA